MKKSEFFYFGVYMKFGGILIIALFCITLHAQTTDTSKTISKNTAAKPEASLAKYQLMLSLESNPFYFDAGKNNFVVQPENYWTTTHINFESLPMTPEMRYKEMASQIRAGLDKAFMYHHQFEEKKSLGVVGQILGYASTAAAGYLLIKHITKYSDEYKKDLGIK